MTTSSSKRSAKKQASSGLPKGFKIAEVSDSDADTVPADEVMGQEYWDSVEQRDPTPQDPEADARARSKEFDVDIDPNDVVQALRAAQGLPEAPVVDESPNKDDDRS